MLSTLKALADPTRLRLLGILAHGEFTVQELTSILAMGQSRISRHLRILTEAGITTVMRQGTWGYYRLDKGQELFAELWPSLEKRLDELAGRVEDRRGLLAVLDERRGRSLQFFDQHAARWDQLARELLPVPDYHAFLLDRVPHCRCLLEIGSGTGRMLAALSHRADKLVAVDNAPAMLAQARQRAATEGLSTIEFRLGDMSHLPLSDSEVDWAVLNMVLHHAAQPARVLSELARVLKPGGGVTIADLQRHEQEWVRGQLADQWLGFDPGELEEWLRAAGFAHPDCYMLPGQGDEQGMVLCSARKLDR